MSRMLALKSLRALLNVRDFLLWKNRNYAPPSPKLIKWKVLSRWGMDATHWIETGTYRGETTLYLAKKGFQVHSIEPSAEIFERTKNEISGHTNIFLYLGTSEQLLDGILDSLIRQEPRLKVSFWLDGHFSKGETFRGTVDTPIEEELRIIADYLDRFESLTVFVDDFRLFRGSIHFEKENYPKPKFLVDWAESNLLTWTIEHDIFVATKKK